MHHNKSTSLLIEGVDDIIKGVERNKEYDLKAFYSKCCLGLKKNVDWSQLLQSDIGNKYF